MQWASAEEVLFSDRSKLLMYSEIIHSRSVSAEVLLFLTDVREAKVPPACVKAGGTFWLFYRHCFGSCS